MATLGARNTTTVRGSDVVRAATSVPGAEVLLEPAGDLTLTGTGTVENFRLRLQPSARLRVAIPPVGHKRRLVVTDVNGAGYGDLVGADIGALTQELNTPATWTASLPVESPKAAVALGDQFREVQFWRGDQLLEWGPIIRHGVTDERLAIECRGADWHLTRRHIGRAGRTNLLTNPGFEDGLAGWNVLRHAGDFTPELAFVLQGASVDAYADVVASPIKGGLRALRIVDQSIDNQKPFVFQDVEVTTGDADEVFVFTAYARINGAAFDGHNPRATGLLLGALPEDYRTLNWPATGAPLPPSGFSNMFWAATELDFLALDFATFDDPPEVDRWTPRPLECSVLIPANTTCTLHARLEGVLGYTYFDDVTLVRDEALVYIDADQTTGIAHPLVYHLQGKDPAGVDDPTLDKSDVNITPTGSPSRVLRDRVYPFADHQGGFEALGELFDLRDGFDYRMVYTPTERRFSTRYPEVGSYHRRHLLTLDRNLASFAYAFDGESAANSVIVLGQGTGAGREEGSAIDPDAFSGGLTLEEVFKAPEGTDLYELDAIGEERLAATRNPHTLALKTRRNPRDLVVGVAQEVELIGSLLVGDYVDVYIAKGSVEIVEGVYRVIRLTLTPTDTLELVLNKRLPR